MILFGIMVAIVGFAAARKVGTAQQLYDSYPLAPAVIAEVNERDMVLLALVNTNVDPSLPPRWAACLRTVTAIPGTQRTVGTKVPVAAVSGRADNNHWQQITPMPIAWGTLTPKPSPSPAKPSPRSVAAPRTRPQAPFRREGHEVRPPRSLGLHKPFWIKQYF